MNEQELSKVLQKPFPASDLEWRVQSAGEKNGKIWARVVAYVTARAIQERLDYVFGLSGWKNEFRAGPDGGVICRIHYRVGEEWLYREDGAGNTDIEAVKGGLSGAMKRAAVQLGIGRYLYGLHENFARVHRDGMLRGRFKSKSDNQYKSFNYDPPPLPAWALPEGEAPPNLTPSGKEPGPEARKIGSAIWGTLNATDQNGEKLFKAEEISDWWSKVQANLDDVETLKGFSQNVNELAGARRE